MENKIKTTGEAETKEEEGNFTYIYIYTYVYIYIVLSLQLCPTLCDPMDCNSPGSCPWDFPSKNTGVGCPFLLQGSSWPRDWIHISYVSCIGRWILLPLVPPGNYFYIKLRNLPAMQETPVWFLGWEDPLQKG